MSDPYGIDMFDFIDLSQVECFNEKQRGQAKQVLRPFNDKLKFLQQPSLKLESDFGTNLVVKIPFNAEVKVKAICVAGAPEGFAPSKMKVYKNE